MRARIAIVAALVAITALATASLAASPPPTLAQQLAKSKANNRTLRLANASLNDQVDTQAAKISDQQDEIDAQDATLGDQGDTIARLRSRIANWPDPVDVITGESPDDQWAAIVAIWRAFPTLDGALCGYDKSNSLGGDVLIETDFRFTRWSGC